MKKNYLLVLLLIMVVVLLAQTAIMPAIGDGTEDNPYQIATWQNLNWITAPGSVDGLTQEDRWSMYYKQTNNIVFPSNINTWNNGEGWLPIGVYNNDYDYLPFSGSFNGNNKTITGLYINRPSCKGQGLFGYTNYAEIKNIGLINFYVTGNDAVGGLVGINNYSTVSNCYCLANVTGDIYIGGLIGHNFCSTISNCYSNGNISANIRSGGLVGANFYEGIIENCYSSGSITCENSSGGLVGVNTSIIKNSFSSCNTNGIDVIGGLVGTNFGTVQNCYSYGEVSGEVHIGGLIGSSINDAVVNSFWDTETSAQSTSGGGTGKTTAEMKNVSTYTEAGWIFPDVWIIDPVINNGYPYLNYAYLVAVDEIVITAPANSNAILNNAYPNPFNPTTTLSFELSSSERVKLDIYNTKGQLVKSLINSSYNTGKHSIVWDGKDNKGNSCGTGIYFYKMQTGKNSSTKKMMLIK